MMERRKVIEILNRIERELPVQQWKYGDVDIWPMVKKRVFFQWFKTNTAPENKAQPLTKKRKVKQLLTSVWNWQKLTWRPLKPVDTLFAGASSHRVDWNSAFINRYFDSLIDDNKIEKFYYVEYGQSLEKPYRHISQILFLEKYRLAALLWCKLRVKTNSLSLPEWNKFKDIIVKDLGQDLTNIKTQLEKDLQGFEADVLFYTYLFKKLSPKQILGLCYYNANMFALHYTANKMGIENYDMQHGGQGRLHPMYYYDNPPQSGYNIVPQKFWCWDKASAKNIANWCELQSFHQVVCKGNPWIEYQLNREGKLNVGKKKIVLYTIQESKLDEYILEAIAQSPEDMVWWLRLHPRKTEAKETIEQQLIEKKCLNKTEIDQATQLPLPQLLKVANIHISKFSGSIIEAAQVGTHSLIIDPIGVESYKEYLDAGLATAVLYRNADTLLKFIESNQSN